MVVDGAEPRYERSDEVKVEVRGNQYEATGVLCAPLFVGHTLKPIRTTAPTSRHTDGSLKKKQEV